MEWFVNLLAINFQDNLHLGLVLIHVGAAVLSLGTGAVAMLTRKGGRRHRLSGKIYFWGMFTTNISALVLLNWRFNLFLLGVTIFSFYAALTGYRVLYRKRPQAGKGAAPLDWGAAGAAVLTGAALIVNSVLGFFGWGAFGIPPAASGATVAVILPLVFGIFIVQGGVSDLRHFVTPVTDKRWWWYYHMNAMCGSYIALVTALMVQQVGPRLPGAVAWIVWVLPGVLGGFGISWWIGRYRRQFAQAPRKAAASVDLA